MPASIQPANPIDWAQRDAAAQTAPDSLPADQDMLRTDPEAARTGPVAARTGPEAARTGPEAARTVPEAERIAALAAVRTVQVVRVVLQVIRIAQAAAAYCASRSVLRPLLRLWECMSRSRSLACRLVGVCGWLGRWR